MIWITSWSSILCAQKESVVCSLNIMFSSLKILQHTAEKKLRSHYINYKVLLYKIVTMKPFFQIVFLMWSAYCRGMCRSRRSPPAVGFVSRDAWRLIHDSSSGDYVISEKCVQMISHSRARSAAYQHSYRLTRLNTFHQHSSLALLLWSPVWTVIYNLSSQHARVHQKYRKNKNI